MSTFSGHMGPRPRTPQLGKFLPSNGASGELQDSTQKQTSANFWRRRKAFDRRREDGVGVSGAAGRLVELGERERGAQAKAARTLLFRDCESGLERSAAAAGSPGSHLRRISPRRRCSSASND